MPTPATTYPDAGVLGELMLDCGVESRRMSGLGLGTSDVIASCFFTADILEGQEKTTGYFLQ